MTFQIEASLLIWWLFWEGWLLVRGCSYHLCLDEKYGSKVFPRNGQFLNNVPCGINQGDFRASRSWNLCFWSLKRFCRFGIVTGLDAYQITNYQFSSKTHYFLLPDFRRTRDRVSKSRVLWPIAWAGVIKSSFDFSKLCPSGHQGLIQMVSKWKGVLSRWIYYQ